MIKRVIIIFIFFLLLVAMGTRYYEVIERNGVKIKVIKNYNLEKWYFRQPVIKVLGDIFIMDNFEIAYWDSPNKIVQNGDIFMADIIIILNDKTHIKIIKIYEEEETK